MIDFHTHILPGIDDGSRSVEESLQLLRRLAAQGVDTVAATPHFYAHREQPTAFLARRQQAYEQLLPHLTPEMPRVLLGAEVYYFRGVSGLPELPALRLQGTRVLLLEMPFTAWSEGEIAEAAELCRDTDRVVLMAHMERYLKFQKPEVWSRLREAGAVMQINAACLLPRWGRRRILRLIREGQVQVLGTDCHNLTNRAPRLAEAREVLAQALGRREADRFLAYGDACLEEWSL